MKSSTNMRKSIRAIVVSTSYLLLTLCTVPQLRAQISVSGGTGLAPTYGSLTAAGGLFAAINATPQTGNNIVITITGDMSSEWGQAPLNAGAWASITITPVGNRTISGAVPAGIPLIDLNGADNVTIDGLNTGGNSLTISNTTLSSTTGTSTIRFIADATNNILRNCTISGDGNTTISGTIFFSTGTSTGNDGNTINACTISGATSGWASNAVYSQGTSTSVDNSGITISNSFIQDYGFGATGGNGIYLATNSSSWDISGNRFIHSGSTVTHRAINIQVYYGGGFIINNNTIGYATYAETGTYAFATGFYGIELWVAHSPVSNIQGNKIAAISGGGGGFTGIYVASGSVNIGTTSLNTIGSGTGTGSISAGTFSGIVAISTGTVSIQNNIIGSVSGSGATYGIKTDGTAGNFTISGNTIGSTSTANSISTSAGNFYGIQNDATGTVSITGNTIQNCTSNLYFYGINDGSFLWGGTGTLTMSNNSIISGTAGSFQGIGCGTTDYASPTTLNISDNIIRNILLTSTTGYFTGIYNQAPVIAAINITNNQLGNSDGDLLTYSAANSGDFTGISNSGSSGSSAAVTITGNNIKGIVHSVQGTSNHTYILNGFGKLSQNISNNTFTNLTVWTTGSVTFIYNGVDLLSTGVQNVNNNSIVTAFNKTGAGGTLTLCTTGASSAVGASVINTGNNFSNITVTGATTIAGWVCGNGGAKTITGNRFNNWTGGTASVTGMSLNGFTGASSVSNNVITNFTGQVDIKGLTINGTGSATALALSNNKITNLVSSGAGGNVSGLESWNLSLAITIDTDTITTLSSTAVGATINGINISASGPVLNVTNNLINTLSATGDAATINAINVSSTGTVGIQNNVIHTITTGGANTNGYTSNGIKTAGGLGNFTISGNTIGNTNPNNISIGTGTTTTGVCTFYGIYNYTATGTISITGNTIQNCSVYGTTVIPVFRGIHNQGGATVTISDNFIIAGKVTTTTGAGTFYGISNSAGSSTLTINGNTIRNMTKTSNAANTGTFTGISNTGIVTNAITIANNHLGDAGGGLITYSATNTGAFTGIENTNVNSLGALTITGNDIRGISQIAASSSPHTYIINSSPTLSQNISDNNFTNLNVATTGNVIFISNNVALLSTGTQNVNNDSIIGTFNKTGAGGTVTLFTTAATSAAGAIINNTGNYFSNITVTGATTIAGWSNLDVGAATKTITGNKFNSWTGGTSAVTGMSVDGFGGASTVSRNTISTFTGQAALTGLTIGATGLASTLALSNNKINSLISSGTGGDVIGLASSNPSLAVTMDTDTVSTLSSTKTTATITAIKITAAGPSLNVTNNLINTLSASGITTPIIYGIDATSTGTVSILNNSIHTISTGGGVTDGYTCYVIHTNGTLGDFTISGNTIGNAVANNISVGSGTTTSGVCFFNGISNDATGPVSISNNTIQNCSSFGTAGSSFSAIALGSGGQTGTISISSNTIIAGTLSGVGAFRGIFNNSGSPVSTVSITNNIIRGMLSTNAGTQFIGISNSSTAKVAITITNNHLGYAGDSLITYNVANGGVLYGIYNSAGDAGAALTITGNEIRGILYAVQGSGAHYYILNTVATLSQNISDNNFTNLNVNTTGNVTFISNNVALSSAGTQTINNDSIIGTFTKGGAGGTVTLFTTAAASAAGATINNNNNNFSNITVTGATTIAGWSNKDLGLATKTISGNTFTNWTCGSGSVTAMDFDGTGSVSSNTINTIAGANTVTGIAMGTTGIQSASLNTINTLSGTGAFAITGISYAGEGGNIFRNKIYDLSGNHASTTVYGITIASGGTRGVTIYNNIIGDLRASAANTADAIRGINILSTTALSTINVYYNTVYLNASSSASPFGTTGIYHTTGIATTATLNLNNNSIVNNSTPGGGGLVVAYRRNNTTLTNYSSTSNNNLFYAGIPGASNLLFYDGTNSEATLAGFKARVSQRESASVTENPPFMSVPTSDANYLHIDATVATQVESGGLTISGITDDFDAQTRQGAVAGTAPDIGADEFAGTTDITAPLISYTAISTNNSCLTSLTFTATITDRTGVNTTPGTKPRVWYKKSTNANALPADNTNGTDGWKWVEATNSSSPYSFTIDLSIVTLPAVAAGDVIQYFVVAQDILGTPLVGMNSGAWNTTPATDVTLASAGVFPIGGIINSYTLKTGISGVKNVPGDYPTLTAAGGLFDNINTSGLTGNLTVNITNNIAETGAITLNPITYGCGSNYTVSISPSGGNWTLSGAVISAPLINLNGADNVTIDGLNIGSSPSLTFSNTSASAGASTIKFSGDATSNKIKNCTISGSCTNASSGTIFFAGGTSSGNDNDTITNCTISAAGGVFPTNAIYSLGTSTTIDNSGIIISNNNIQDYFNAAADNNGVYVSSYNSSWTITGNKFFQSGAAKNITGAATHRAININTANGGGYTINSNTIGYGSAVPGGTTTYTGGFDGRFYGIEITAALSPVSTIQGNTIASVSLTTGGIYGTAPGVFSGVYVKAGSVTIGSNIIGVSGTGTISLTAGSGAYLAGIYATSIGTVTIQNNRIGSISTSNGAIGYIFNGINTDGVSGNFTISGNLIGSTSTANSVSVGGTTVISYLYGINNLATGTISISNDTIQNCSVYGTTIAPVFTGILNSAGSGTVTISDNYLITGKLTTTSGAGTFLGISNTSAPSTLIINGNTIRSMSKIANAANTGAFTGIKNAGAATTAITINNNHLGDVVSGLITYSNTTSGAGATLTGISNTQGGAGSALTITGNDIRGISQVAASTNPHIYIINSAATLSQNISDNTFTNLNVATTTGSITFISNNVALLSTGTQNVNNNRIVTAFTKTGAGGSVILFTTAATSALGAIVNDTANNFSNITVSGTTTIAGWSNLDGGFAQKTIRGNVFNTWLNSTGTGAMTAMNINGFGGTSSVSNNTITNIAGQGAITGLTVGSTGKATTLAISNNAIRKLVSSVTGGSVTGLASSNPSSSITINANVIDTLSSVGAAVTISAINITASGPTLAITNSRIRNLSATGITTPTLNAINVTSTGTVSIQNDTINTISTGGVATSGYTFNAIKTAGTVGNYTISNNIIGTGAVDNISIGTAATTSGICTFNGITNSATGTISISSNILQNCSSYGDATAASVFTGITNSSATGALTISDNSLIVSKLTGTGAFTAISSNSNLASLTFSGNIIRNITLTATTSIFTGVSNSGAVANSITITNNQLGNATGGLITFSAANSSAWTGTGIISNTGGGPATVLTITGNDIRGIVNSVPVTNVHTYIFNSYATLSQNISNNTFTNLSANTTGNVTFIDNSVAVLSTGTQNVNNNRIVTAFTKPGTGGTVTLFTTSATSAYGAIVNDTANNFSNITVTGATSIAGWKNLDVGYATKTITGNIFNNWTGSTGAATVTGINIDGFGGASSVSRNTITNFAGQAAITGLTIGANSIATTLALSNNKITNFTSSGTGGVVTALASANSSLAITVNADTINTLSSSGVSVGLTPLVAGINITASGSTLTVSNNPINTLSASGTGTVSLYPISVTSNGTVGIQNNTIHTISTSGGVTDGYRFNGIYTPYSVGNFTITGNTIGSAAANNISIGTGATTSGVCTMYGINNAATGTISITGNTVQNCTSYGTGASEFYGVFSSGASGSLTVSSNNVIVGKLTGTGNFKALSCTAASSNYSVNTLTVSGNIIRNSTLSSTTGTFTGIYAGGSATDAVTITDNQLGNASGGLVTYSAANSSPLNGIVNNAGALSATLTITGNNIKGIVHSVQGTNTHDYITNSANNGYANLSQNISNNTFDSLTVNTTGSIIFINNNVALSSTGTQNINNNSIVTGFRKKSAGGTVTLFTTSATSATGAIINNTGNNFSNLAVTGATTIAGWKNKDAGPATKTITGNKFNNWTGGTSAVTVMDINGFAGASSVSNDTITNITGESDITGLTIGTTGSATTLALSNNIITNLISSVTGGNIVALSSTNPSLAVNMNGNTINTLSSTGAAATVTGIYATTSQAISISSNTIQNCSVLGTGASVFKGIYLIASGTHTVNSNTIGSTTNNNMTCAGNSDNYGIISGLGCNLTCNNNTIQEFNLTNTGTAATFYGIFSWGGTNTFQNDTIREIDMLTTNTTVPSLSGIYMTSASTSQTISKCAVKNMNHLTASANVVVHGIYASATSTGSATISKCVVSGNKVVSNGATAANSGIYLTGAGSFNLSNNVVLADNGGDVQSPLLTGIYVNATGTTTVYHNSIKLYGTSTTGSQASACLFKNNNSGTLTVKNNIFQNNRENGRLGGMAYAIKVNDAGGSKTFDYNYLETLRAPIAFWTADKAAIADWRTISGASAFEITGAITLNWLGFTNNPIVRDAGTNLLGTVADDKDGNARDASPWIGGWEAMIPLPIELLTFSGYNTANGNVLYWSTASETNNDFFTLERAVDATNFSPIAVIDGAGNSTQVLNYSTLDSTPVTGYNYYRLKQTDWDGQFKYSQTIAIENKLDETMISDVFPNPALNQVSFDYYSPVAGTIHIQVTDNLGRVLMDKVQQIPVGNSHITTDISPLAAGVYFFKVMPEQKGYDSITKVVKN